MAGTDTAYPLSSSNQGTPIPFDVMQPKAAMTLTINDLAYTQADLSSVDSNILLLSPSVDCVVAFGAAPTAYAADTLLTDTVVLLAGSVTALYAPHTTINAVSMSGSGHLKINIAANWESLVKSAQLQRF